MQCDLPESTLQYQSQHMDLNPDHSVADPRVTAGCNAWFYCEDTACVDWQTTEAVTTGQCILMTASVKPQPEPLLKDVTKPDDFFSYQAGYIKGAPQAFTHY